jgi:hypothetical protein
MDRSAPSLLARQPASWLRLRSDAEKLYGEVSSGPPDALILQARAQDTMADCDEYFTRTV